MTERRALEELWARLSTGDTLSPEEDARLADALARDPGLARICLDDQSLEGTLRELGRTAQQREGLAARFVELVHADRGGEAFVERFKAQLRQGEGVPPPERPREPHRRRRWLASAIPAAAVLAVGIGAAWWWRHSSVSSIATVESEGRGPGAAVIEQTAGTVLVVGGAGEARPARPGLALEAGATVRTEAAASVLVRGADGASLAVRPRSSVWFRDAMAPGARIHVARGQVVATLPARSPPLIDTPHATVEGAPGASFLISVDHRTRLLVLRGEATLTRAATPADARSQDTVTLAKGEYAVSRAGVELRARSLASLFAAPTPQVLFRYDFEDGRRPPEWRAGVVGRCADHAESRFCLSSELYSPVHNSNGVLLYRRLPEPLMRYSQDLVVEFDYRVSAGVSRIDVGVESRRFERPYHHVTAIRAPAVERWSRARVRVADMRPETAWTLPALAADDPITLLKIRIVSPPPATLHVDNVVLLREPVAVEPDPDAAGLVVP